MKTYNHLFEKVVDKDNIRKAILKAARGKRRKATVRKTLKHIDEAVEYLHNQLVSGTWRPVEIHQTKEINDGVELKKTIYCLSVFSARTMRAPCDYEHLRAVIPKEILSLFLRQR